MIGSRFEVDASKATCRLAFYGRLAGLIDVSDPQQMRKLRIFKVKRRSGSIDRMNKDGLSAVCKGMFKKETDITVFAGLKVGDTDVVAVSLAHFVTNVCLKCSQLGMASITCMQPMAFSRFCAHFSAGGHAGRPHRHY